MTKGSYTVGDDGTRAPPQNDTSYRSFICVLLIFLAICLIILLGALVWGTGRREPISEQTREAFENLAQKGSHEVEDVDRNVARTNKTHEGMKMRDETTTESATTEENVKMRDETTTERKLTTATTEESTRPTFSPTVLTTLRTTTKIRTTEAVPVPTELLVPTELTTGQTPHDKAFDNDSTTMEATLTTTNSATEDLLNISKVTESANTPISQEQEDITSTVNSNTVTEEPGNSTTTTIHGKSSQAPTTPERYLPPIEPPTTTEISESTTEENPPLTLPITRTATTTSTTTSSTTTTSTTEISIMESDAITESDPLSPATNTSTSPTQDSVITEPILLRMRSSPLVQSPDPVCTTAACKTEASRILSMMNHSSEPCVDFYEFACGNFYQTLEDSSEDEGARILDEELYRVGSSSAKFLRDLRGFYQSCVVYGDRFNYKERMRGLEGLLEEVGQFQLVNDTEEVDLTDLVSSLLLRQSMPLFDIGLDVDRQSSNFILQLNLPHQSFLRTSVDDWSGLTLLKKRCLQRQKARMHHFNISLTDVYSLYQMCQADYSTYLNSLETVIRDLTDFSILKPDVLFKEIKDIRFTIEFEVLNNLDTLPSSATILSNFINKNYEMRKVSDLQLHFPLFDWKRLFRTLTGHQVEDGTLVQVYFAKYFQDVFRKLHKVNKRKLNNAFLAIHSYDLFLNTVVPKGRTNRNNFCADLSKKLLPDVWSQLVHEAIPASQQEYDNQQVTKLFEELKATFCRSLFDSEWIDEDTKVAIKKKCGSLNIVTFQPPNVDSLAKNYELLNVTQDYQSNLILLLTNFRKLVYGTEGKYPSAGEIFSNFLDPMSRKPLTFYSNPMIAVPLGLMRRSRRSLPDYLVKTKVGFSLARQLARHFDPTGMTYGVRLRSVSKSSYSEFVQTMTNLMDYSSPRMFHDKNISFILNGSLSINERIVDNTAFRLIYDSLDFQPDENILPWISAQYSREKVFFIAAAQELCKKTSMSDFMLQVFEQRHLPAVLRVENIMGNSQQFASMFSCPAGSGMDFPVKLQFPDLEIQEEEEYQEENDNLEENK